jgi:hypothetical protein
MLHLLASEPPSVGRHNGGKRASKHVNLGRKIMCLHCDLFVGFLPVIGIHIIMIGSFLDTVI